MTRIHGTFFIEAQGDREDFVEDSLKALLDNIKNEEGIEVKGENIEDTLEEEGMFSSAAEVDLVFEDFSTYVNMAIKYGPSAIEIAGPKEMVLPSKSYLETVGAVIKLTKTLYDKYGAGFRFPQQEREPEIGLSEDEIDGLLDQGALHTKIVVESRGRSEKEAVRDLVNAVKEDLFVNKALTKSMEEGEGFSGLIGIEAFMYEARILFDIAIAHTPVLIEIIEPDEVRLKALDIQDIGVDMAGLFFELAHKVEAMKRG